MANNLFEFWKERAQKLSARSSHEESPNLNCTAKSDTDPHSCSDMPQEPSPQLPDNFEATDMRALMERLRALANQI